MKCQSKSWDVWLTFREKLRPPPPPPVRCCVPPGALPNLGPPLYGTVLYVSWSGYLRAAWELPRRFFSGRVQLRRAWRRCWTPWRREHWPWTCSAGSGRAGTGVCRPRCWLVAGTARQWTQQCAQTTAMPGTYVKQCTSQLDKYSRVEQRSLVWTIGRPKDQCEAGGGIKRTKRGRSPGSKQFSNCEILFQDLRILIHVTKYS